MGHMGHTSATHDVHCLPFGCVPGTADPGHRFARPLMLCAAAQSSNPHRVQPQPHTYPQVPQPTLLGARESDETTLPLLNRVILLSFAHVTDNERADLRI